MARPTRHPSPEELEKLLHEPVEAHIEDGGQEVGVYRGILLPTGDVNAYYVRHFGSQQVRGYTYDPAEPERWQLIRRLELSELDPLEQQVWFQHTPIDVMIYVSLECSRGDGLFSPLGLGI